MAEDAGRRKPENFALARLGGPSRRKSTRDETLASRSNDDVSAAPFLHLLAWWRPPPVRPPIETGDHWVRLPFEVLSVSRLNKPAEVESTAAS